MPAAAVTSEMIVSVVQPPPFETQLFTSQRPDAIELALDR
jgi:hypothetical protein